MTGRLTSGDWRVARGAGRVARGAWVESDRIELGRIGLNWIQPEEKVRPLFLKQAMKAMQSLPQKTNLNIAKTVINKGQKEEL